MRKTNRCKRILPLLLAGTVLAGQLPLSAGGLETQAAGTGAPVITVDAYTQRAEISPYTLGSNHRHAYGGFGMYDEENDRVYPDFLEKTKASNLGVVRYPGGTIANLFTWKDTIGPREERSNVVLGNNYASVFPYYGLDEHMAYTEEIGAEVLYMVGEAAETPQSAADLVEYMNAENDGSNPGGGIDWAAVRAENGHPEPYNVIYYEIGNEMYIDAQMYWLTLPSVFGETDRAKRYALGDTVQATGSPLRVKGTWKDNLSQGRAGETFYTQYNPVVEGSEAVYVDGEKWTRTDSLESAGKRDKVYVIDYETGRVSFGDGEKGVIPPKDAPITADYQHKHAGFIEYYEAMKAIDPDIKIFSTLPYVYNFVPSDQCDGIVYHNYTGYPSSLSTAEEVHDHYMSVSDKLCKMIDGNVTDLRAKSGRNDTIAAVTEFGTLDVSRIYSEDASPEGREEARSLSRALSFAVTFMGSSKAESLIHIQQAFTAYSFGGGPGLPGADSVYNSMYAPYPDDPSKFVEGGTALAYKVIGNNKGDTVRNSYIENNPVVKRSTTYDALQVLATQTDENGDLYLLAVNRDSENDITATVNLTGYTIAGPARIQTLNGADITSCNTPENPDAISIAETEAPLGIGGDSFSYTFPAHSLVAIKLSGTSKKPYTDNFSLRHFGAAAIGAVPSYFKVEAGTASVQSARDVANPDNKAFQITRQGANVRVRAALSGQDATVESPKTYDGLMKISFLVKALQDGSRLDISAWAGGKEAFNLAFENKKVMNDGAVRAVYEKDRFYEVEMVLDHKAGQYVFYLDGSYIGSASKYNSGITAPLDYLVFDVENQNGSFLIDDFLVQSAPNKIVSKITQADDVRLTTQAGNAPVLPETVTVRYNTGESEIKAVTWDEIDPASYAQPGSYTVAGAIEGIDLKARAVVTVVRAVKEIAPVAVSTLAGILPQLPREVTVTYSDGETVSKRVTWDVVEPAQYQSAGSFTVEGSVEDTLGRAAAVVTVIARANVPRVTVEAFTERAEPCEMLAGRQVNAFTSYQPGGDGLWAEAAKDEQGNLCLLVVNPKEAVTVSVNLLGYQITGDAVIRTAAYTEGMDTSDFWNDAATAETQVALGVGGSSFSYTIPARSVVAIKPAGAVGAATPWAENFWVRHFGLAGIGAVPSYFSLQGGAASVQKDPVNSAEQVFMVKREGADTSVKATISGQDFPADNLFGYSGMLQITFQLKAAQTAGRFYMQICSGDNVPVELGFDGGKLTLGHESAGSYQANQWYDMELVLDHTTGGYVLYADGSLVGAGGYEAGTQPLDYILFGTQGQDGIFYLDNFHIKNISANMVPQITQIENIYATTKAGTAPVLPAKVLAGYNTGEKESRPVSWEAARPEQYAKRGVFILSGVVEGLGLTARAVITVTADVQSIAPVEVSTIAGTAPKLPAQVSVTYEDDSAGLAAVVWEDIDPQDYAREGSFTVSGAVEGTDKKAAAIVTVLSADAKILEILPVEVWTRTGEAPLLPETVQVKYEDSVTARLPVTWEDVDSQKYAASGVITVKGSVEGCKLDAQAQVTVYLPGDMNKDDNVNIEDVMEACKVLARKSAGKEPTADEMRRGNLDADMAFTITDVMEICKILARRA